MYTEYPEIIPDIRTELYNYCKKVIAGKIVACQKYIWACQRFINDVKRIKDDKWEWTFDNQKAFDYIDIWVPMFKHSKGLIAGERKIFTDYERFIYGNIYGWVAKRDSTIRRFRRSYEQVARKNSKSMNKAIQALYELTPRDNSIAEIYIAATKKEQTRHVWGEAVWQYENNELLRDKFVCKNDKELKEVVIRHLKSKSFFARLSKDDKKLGDGTNPSFFIIDEYHLHTTDEYYNLAISGMKTRKNPLLSIITTAGNDIHVPCYRIEYKYCSKILDPNDPTENDRYFVAISEIDKNESTETIEINGKKIEPGYPIDDIYSLKAIQKSNPILCRIPESVQLIKEEIQEATDKPEMMQKVLTKTLNMWVNQKKAGYMDMAKWKLCECNDNDILETVLYDKQQPFLGFDLSSTIDLTSIAIVVLLPGGEYYIISHSFMPEDTVKRAIDRDKVPYDIWIKEGFITATPGNDVDYHMVLEWTLKQFKLYNWKKGEACFDRALATWLEHELDKKGFIPIDIPQSYTGLSLATKTLRAKVYNKQVLYQPNPLLTWAMGNCVLRTGPSENILIDKPASIYRIDPVASLINAMTRAIANEKPKKSNGRVIFA